MSDEALKSTVRQAMRSSIRAIAPMNVPIIKPVGVVTLAIAQPHQFRCMHEITRQAFAEYDGKLNPPSAAVTITLDELTQQMAEGGGVLAQVCDTPVGSALFRLRPDHLYIGRLAVLPALRGRGIASAILDYMEQIAAAAGLAEMRLGTRVSMERNIALYERHGYVITSEQPHPAAAGPDKVVWMTRRLN